MNRQQQTQTLRVSILMASYKCRAVSETSDQSRNGIHWACSCKAISSLYNSTAYMKGPK
jgi:hypothetical protein